MNDFNLFLPISKVDKARRTVSGYASTASKDLDGEIVALDAVKAALPDYMQWGNIRRMHTNDAVGIAKEANTDEKGLFLVAKIVDDDAWQKCLEGVYKGFSIGGRKLAKSGDTITKIDLVEISVVDRPANPDCKFEVQKAAKGGPAHLVRPKKPADPREKAMGKLASAVELLAKAGATGCEAHGKVDCAECAEVSKREVSTSERDSLAGSGDANPDGSFPIKTKSDLENAIRAFGRNKNKAQTKKLIMRRARELGATDLIPAKWSEKAEKKTAAKVAKAAVAAPPLVSEFLPPNDLPADETFLILKADSGAGRSAIEDSSVLSCHGASGELALWLQEGAALGGAAFTKREQKLLKRMGVAGSLAFCFDSIRDAQRSLLREAKIEGGDMKDKTLALKLGAVAQSLAEVIGQKAAHEGVEATDFSDADDQGFLDLYGEDLGMSAKAANANDLGALLAGLLSKAEKDGDMKPGDSLKSAEKSMKRARKIVKAASGALEEAHKMHKAAYLSKQADIAKAGGKADASDFDHAKAMQHIQKAYGDLNTIKTLMKAASSDVSRTIITLVGTQPADPNSKLTIPDGFQNITLEDMLTAGPSGEGRGTMPDALKSATIPREVVEQMIKNATLEAENTLLKAMPAGGGRSPMAFDLSKLGGADSNTFGLDNATGLPKDVFKGVNTRALVQNADPSQHEDAMSKVIGNLILGGHGKNVFSPDFHGTAGAGNAK